MSRFTVRSFVGIAVAVIVAGFLALPAWAIHSWGGYHWARTANPFALRLIDSVDGWEGELATTSIDWSQSAVLDLTVVPGDSSVKTRKRCSASQGAVRVCNADYGQNGWLGLAQIWLDPQGHITAGTSKMNDSYWWYWTPEERNHVMCQEVGHTFGLGHQDESGAALGTCMDYSSDPGSQHPNAHDYEELELIYAHLDAYTTVSDGSGGGGGGCKGRNCSGNGMFDGENWGYLVHKNAHSEVYMRRDADGRALLTHLYLVPER